ncbi:MAG: sodium-dependent transporter, partial [Acidobacteria bacterium]|nr:sodium-dependent transporter [Acidobacteriota bacterium]
GLGMAVGTGSMWRFPRVAAQYGGAAFLIPWIIFLFLWSIPLLIAEFAIGRGARRGVIGAFTRLTDGRYTWMGAFMALATCMILFYYSVVTGWTLKYLLVSVTGELRDASPAEYWNAFIASGWEPTLWHIGAALLSAFVIQRGVVRGIEAANKILVPILFFMLVIAALRAITLPGASRGLEFLFSPSLAPLADARTWLEALTQSAWSTGAGWGLLLTYAVYSRKREDIVVNSSIMGFGVYTCSMLAGLAVVPTAFAFLSTEEAMTAMAAGNQGLMFIWMPRLFYQMPAGGLFLFAFMVALVFAAISSIIAMFELAVRLLMDTGIPRRRSLALVTGATIFLGFPSALSPGLFDNQDFVWGQALTLSGLFISLAASRYGSRRFRNNLVNIEGNDLNVGRGFEFILKYVVPVELAVMMIWWVKQSVADDPGGWWNPAHAFSLGTCLAQWGVGLIVLWIFSRQIGAASVRQTEEVEP